MAGDDDFDIDVYAGASNETDKHQDNDYQDDGQDYQNQDASHDNHEQTDNYQQGDQGGHDVHDDHSAGESKPPQGVKRKSEEDDRPVDQNATAAIMISELNWWVTDDDIRGWLRQANCEDDAKDLTFSEHKVNGKSKGQAYIEFYSPSAATSAKHGVDQIIAKEAQPGQKKTTTSYWNPGMNPFRTLPKDAPARVKEQPRAAPSGPYNDRGGSYGGGFRGRGGYGGRGNMNQNYNRNFNNNNNMGGGGYNNNNMGGGFNGPMGGGGGGGGGGNFGFQGRGNMMGGGGGMRGGPGGMRGGRGGNMMGMNPMGGMPMGMPGNMGMGMMNPGMGGFQGMPPNFGGNFSGNFGYGQNQGGGDWGNPHGAKRPRPE